jgi:serine protease Do
VNPGNSGGPLINMSGEVVGINSQIYSRTGSFAGISFAIPMDEATRVADSLKSSGRVVRGRIGVGITDVTKEIAEPLGLAKASGALVRNVESGGPADKAGVEAGDIITRFDGKSFDKSNELPRIVGATKPGSKVNLSVWRKGANKELTVTVAEIEPDKVVAAAKPATPAQPVPPVATTANSLGLAVSDLSDERRTQLKIKNGVVVETVDGPGARSGIRPGDVLLALNNQDITSAKQFAEMASKLDKTRSSALLVRRGDGAQFVPIRPVVLR